MGSNTLTSKGAINSGFRKADKFEPYIWLGSNQLKKTFFVRTVIGPTERKQALKKGRRCRLPEIRKNSPPHRCYLLAVVPVVPAVVT